MMEIGSYVLGLVTLPALYVVYLLVQKFTGKKH